MEGGGGGERLSEFHWCVGSQGRDMTARGPPWEQNGLPPMANIMQIASAKSRSMRAASHQPGFIDSCLTIRHVFALSTWWWMG